MFDLELEKVIGEIKERQPKRVLIQLPDGLKTRAGEVCETIEKETGVQVCIWFSSCFGACDLPLGLSALGIDLMIQWGHNRYHKSKDMW